jgi:hypothetical protein
MTKTQTAIDRALLGLHLSEDEVGHAMGWLAAEVGLVRSRGGDYVDLPSGFNIHIARRAVNTGLVDHFRYSAQRMRLFIKNLDAKPAETSSGGPRILWSRPGHAA